MTATRTAARKPRQCGIALFIVAVFLVALGLLGLNTLQGAHLATWLARIEADRLLALHAAEAALRDAEHDLEGRRFDDTPCPAGTAGCRPAGERPIVGAAGLSAFRVTCGDSVSRGQCLRAEDAYFAAPVWRDATLLEQAATYGAYTGAPPLERVRAQPRYLLEGFRRGSGYAFRITAFAQGALPATHVVLQSTYLMTDES